MLREFGLFLLGALLRGLVRVIHPRDGEVLVLHVANKDPEAWRELSLRWRAAGGHAVVVLQPGELATQEPRRLTGEDRGLPPARKGGL